MDRRTRRIFAAALLGSLSALEPLAAADLVEPWQPGWTDLELFTAFAPDSSPQRAILAGFGLGGGLSLGVSLATGGAPSEIGLVLVWSRALGRFGDLDLLFEVNTVAREAELGEFGRAGGIEWSAPDGRRPRPYARLTAWRDDGGAIRFHPLVGLNFTAGRVDLHLELSAEEPIPGERWPIHLAVGPNLAFGDGFELLPELSLLYDRDAGRVDPALTVGVVTSPAALGAAVAKLVGGR